MAYQVNFYLNFSLLLLFPCHECLMKCFKMVIFQTLLNWHMWPVSGNRRVPSRQSYFTILSVFYPPCQSVWKLSYTVVFFPILLKQFNIYQTSGIPYSTTNQSLYIVHKIRSAWQQGNIVQVSFMDVDGAFEKIRHKGLLAKLEQALVTENWLKLFESYLSNRRQVVVIDGVKSDVLPLKAGIPQGSKLGPILFILYISDIHLDLESEVLIYADDTTLLAFGKNPVETALILNRDLKKISDLAKMWKISFNAEKSRDIIFSEKSFPHNPNLFIDGDIIKRVSVHKHLGSLLKFRLVISCSVCLS